jgi:hypothetical protein
MRTLRLFAALLCLAGASLLVSAAPLANQVTGLDIANFDGRDVLVIRTTGDVPAPGTYSRNVDSATVSFRLQRVGDGGVAALSGSNLIRSVSVSGTDPTGTEFTVTLASAALVEQSQLRFSQPSDHVVLLEVFPASSSKSGAVLITDIYGQLGLEQAPQQPVAAPRSSPATHSSIDSLAIPTLDLADSDPQRVLTLAATTGLLDITSSARVATQNLGELTVKPAGQSLANWCEQSPPGELYLSGTPDQIASFMQLAEPRTVGSQPAFVDYWADNKPLSKVRPVTSGGYSATRSRVKDDPYAGIYHTDMIKQSRLLSDVRVTLPAMSGMNLYDVLNYLSLISGISLIIDPYSFDDPTGMRRDPLDPEPPEAQNSQPGFRPSGVFDPQTGRPGTVMGNFDNVPFDTALKLILETHGLKFVVYGGGGDAQRYGKSSGAGDGGYSKPVVLVTSPERLEQEIAGTNQIDLYQFHYADPYLVSELLNNFDLTPGTDSGWYIYQGSGTGYGQGSGGGTGSGSGGNRGGGGGTTYTASSGLLVYRGSDRTLVEQAVAEAAGRGENLVRVILRPESGNQLVTAFAR